MKLLTEGAVFATAFVVGVALTLAGWIPSALAFKLGVALALLYAAVILIFVNGVPRIIERLPNNERSLQGLLAASRSYPEDRWAYSTVFTQLALAMVLAGYVGGMALVLLLARSMGKG